MSAGQAFGAIRNYHGPDKNRRKVTCTEIAKNHSTDVLVLFARGVDDEARVDLFFNLWRVGNDPYQRDKNWKKPQGRYYEKYNLGSVFRKRLEQSADSANFKKLDQCPTCVNKVEDWRQ